jgi:hypothetical protein
LENPKKISHLEEMRVDGRIILKCMDGYEVDSYGLEYGQMMDPCGQVDEN